MTVIEYITDQSPFVLCLMSDLHIGGLHVDYKLIEKELADAKKRGAKILINGDVFDAILPGDRKRYRANNLHPRLYDAGDDMLGESIRWAYEILAPYKDDIIMIGDGNHDDAVARYHHIEPVKHLIVMLNGADGKIQYGGYHGFIHVQLRPFSDTHYGHYVIHYHHGAGGAAPVTKGAITFSRAAMWIEGADAIWRGHTHHRQAGRDNKVTFNKSVVVPENRVMTRDVLTLRTGSYFDTYVGTTSEQLLKHGRRDSYAALWDSPTLPKGGLMLTLNAVHSRDVRGKGSTVLVKDTLEM
jgi:UDP-2,3-diacylglucosamine pyrophosphatase LpxH